VNAHEFANPYLQVKPDGLWIVMVLTDGAKVRRRITRERAREMHHFLELFAIDNEELTEGTT
jgi:hypothetical protein